MEWYVYKYDINKDKIKKFNVFDYWVFNIDVVEGLKKCKTKNEFSKSIKSKAMYYFWSKSEHELIATLTEDNRVLLTPWCGCRNPDKATIDVTDDSFDWKGFVKKHIGKQVFKNEVKIDIYDQLNYVWKDFVDYVWSCR